MAQPIDPQAEELNRALPAPVLALLSQKGIAAYWPVRGILQQAAEAKEAVLDASVGIAYEDDDSPMRLEAMGKNLLLPPKDAYPYAPGFGVKELREVWKRELKAKNPSLTTRTSLPVVTTGLTHALSVAGSLFLNPGDTVLLPDLYWPNYGLIFEQGYGAKLVPFPMFTEGGFNVQGFKSALKGSGKKVILLNFPNNPTGYTPTEEEAKRIVTALKETAENGPLLVILDDAYFGLVYEEGVARESLFAALAELHENLVVVKVDGASKEEFAWGFRVGFLTYAGKSLSEAGVQALEAKTAGTVRATVSNAPHHSQSLILAALKDPTHHEEKLQKFSTLKARYATVKKVLEKKEYRELFIFLPFNSGYFLCLELKAGIDAEAVRQKLLKDGIGVIALPGNLLRVAYSGIPASKLSGLFDKIASACKNWGYEDLNPG